MSTKRAAAPTKIALAIASLMAVLLVASCMAVQNQAFDADKAKKQAKFEIQTKLPKAELFEKLASSSKGIFAPVRAKLQSNENAGVITGRYISARGSYKDFSSEQAVDFTLRLSGQNSVMLEFRVDGYAPDNFKPDTIRAL